MDSSVKFNMNSYKIYFSSHFTSIFFVEPSGPPQDVRVTAESSTTLRVTWDPPPREHWNGNIMGYYLGHRAHSLPSDYNFQTVEVSAFTNNYYFYLFSNIIKYLFPAYSSLYFC